MARKMTEWPSKRGPITKIMPSDGCIGDTVPLAVGKWYDFHEFGWYMGNVGIHTICPGFSVHCRGETRARWDALSFYNPGFDYGYGRFIAGNEAVFSPLENPAIRVVYIFRNPLDQCVSFFRHTRKHRQGSMRSFVDGDGAEIEIEDERDYLRRVGIEAYVKQYVTFHVMKQRCPDNLFMLPYERMLRDRDGSFREMLAFLEFELDGEEKETAFQKGIINLG